MCVLCERSDTNHKITEINLTHLISISDTLNRHIKQLDMLYNNA